MYMHAMHGYKAPYTCMSKRAPNKLARPLRDLSQRLCEVAMEQVSQSVASDESELQVNTQQSSIVEAILKLYNQVVGYTLSSKKKKSC